MLLSQIFPPKKYAAFKESNVIGVGAEKRIADVLFYAGWLVQRRSALHKRDLAALSSHGVELIEVKNEDAQKTQNVCIEMFQGSPRRESGILLSESTIYVHTFGDECVVYRTKKMLIYLWSLPHLPLLEMGDNKNQCVLVRKSLIAAQPWGDQTAINALALSKVFRS